MKKNKSSALIASLCIGLLITPSFAWQWPYGDTDDDWCYSGCQAGDGNFLFAGSSQSYSEYGDRDMWVFRTDTYGELLKIYTFGSAQLDDEIAWMEPTPDGGAFLFADSYKFSDDEGGGNNVILYKIDQAGDTVGAKPYFLDGVDKAIHFCKSTDGGYMLLSTNNEILRLIKINGSGDSLWARIYPELSSFNRTGRQICQTMDGGYMIVGTSEKNGTKDLWLLWVDAVGDTIWSKEYGGDGVDEGFSVIATPDTGCIALGFSSSEGANGRDLWILKVIRTGYMPWQKFYGGAESEMGTHIERTSDGGYIVGGTTSSYGQGGVDYWLMKLDENLDTVWTRTYGFDGDDYCWCVRQTADRGFLMVGYTNSFPVQMTDAFVVKTDSLGGIAESAVGWDLASIETITAVGDRIVLRYGNYPGGFRASVYDASGRLVDELYSQAASGSLTWGEAAQPGVYFIHSRGESNEILKVILIR